MQLSSTTGSPFAFTGNSFVGYGPTVFAFNTTSDVDAATDVVTETAHGYTTGMAVEYRKQGGSAAIGLTDATTYYVRAVSSSTLAFYTSSANAIADTSRIALTSTGSETHYINSIDAAIYNNSGGAITLNVSGGTTPTIRNGSGATTTVNSTVTITVTPLTTGSEVRAYATGTSNELSGTESSTGSSYALSLPSGTAVDIVILCYSPPKVPVRFQNVSFTVNQNLNPGQLTDRNFSNP